MISEELSGVLIDALRPAEALQLDVAKTVADKLETNAEKYPADDECGSVSWLDSSKGGDV